MTTALIALGSNTGDRPRHLDRALARLNEAVGVKVVCHSQWQATQPVGGPVQGEYLNGAVVVETSLSPERLLAELRRIEAELGRVRNVRWGERTIDLDLLLFGQKELESAELVLPHPRMAFRRFVLDPACEIAADWIYPLNGWSLAQLRQHLDDSPQKIAIVGSSQFLDIAAEIHRQHPQWECLAEWPLDGSFRLVVIAGVADQTTQTLEVYNARRHQTNSPPVLWLPHADPATLMQEVLAAIEAME